jgi:hypothetical protein
VTPFEMMYGQEAVLPVEINLSAYRVMHQDSLTAEEYKCYDGWYRRPCRKSSGGIKRVGEGEIDGDESV